MQAIRNLLLLTLICITSANESVYPQNKIIDLKPYHDTIRVLKNPYKGWYHHLLDNGIKKYGIRDDSAFASFPVMDHIYLRLAWSYLEPAEGQFDWTDIDRVIAKYVPGGYRISFRITCSETGTYPDSFGEQTDGVCYATPGWVRNAGAKGTVVDNGRIKFWVPDWDDPVYLEKLDHFHEAFAARYDNQPWISYVDIGSIGDWGEGHTSFSTKITPTAQEVKANIDIYFKNYKNTQIVANDDIIAEGRPEDEVQELYLYATTRGITLRDDSPLVDWYFHNFLHTSTLSHPQLYDPLYLKEPIVLEMEHYRSVKKHGNWLGKNGETIIPEFNVSGADILREVLKKMHATYIGYHGYAEEWLAENPDLTRELANHCGYWYFPTEVTVPEKMEKGENPISIEWLNKGVAPAYNVFSIILRFESEKAKNSFDILIKDSGNMNWLPDILVKEKYRITIPSEAQKGLYRLSFKLADISGGNMQEIQLGLKQNAINSQGFIYVDTVSVK